MNPQEPDILTPEEDSEADLFAAVDEELSATKLQDEPEPPKEPDKVEQEPDKVEQEPDNKPETPPAEPDEKPAEPVVPPEPLAAKPSDEFGTLEKDTPQKTRERFETIKKKYDDLVAERDAVKAESQQWVEAITGTGTNAEQFQMALGYLSAVNSGTQEGLEKAYGIMQQELEVLGKALGKSAPGIYDRLSDHPDLKERVDSGMLDESDANEIIQARASKRWSESQTQRQQQETQKQTEVDSAMSQVKALGAQLQATDPLFASKMPFMTPIIEAAIASGAPPAQWASMIKIAYDKLPAPTVETPPKPIVPNPIRPTGANLGGNGLQKEPQSELEAMDMALERGY